MSTDTIIKPPKLWKYLLGAIVLLAILIPLWTIIVMVYIQPNSLMTATATMGHRLLWWVAGPMAVVILFFSWRWSAASKNAQAKQQQQVIQVQVQQVVESEQSKREYVLEVIGLGVTLDKYRQGELWEALQKGSPYVTIREQDREKYPWSAQDKIVQENERQGNTLENGAKYTPMYWGVPVFNAVAPIHNEQAADKPNLPRMGLADSAGASGMDAHLFVAGPRRFDEHPDRILEDVFAFFDANPDVPYVILNSHDGTGTRDRNSPLSTPLLLKEGHVIPPMPDASTLFVLARRERVESVRPFAWDDPNNKFVKSTLSNMYSQLQHAVPHPDRIQILRTPAQVGADLIDADPTDAKARQPLIAEWCEAAAAFAQRPDIRDTGVVSMLEGTNHWEHRPPKEWKPTLWFPIPWNKYQLATFDKLPTLGFIHRPTFVKFRDEHRQLIKRQDEREKALRAGWQEALHTLSEAERTKAPARIIASMGTNTYHLAALHSVLNDHTAHGGPEIDSSKSDQFIDTDRRLENTGATTLFMQMAIGVIGSYRLGGISAAVNLRNANEASIVFISPPSDDQRKAQKHLMGGDVFAHQGAPDIDPSNYIQN